VDEVLAERWERLMAVRGEVLKALEQARNSKVIGTSLEAHIDLYAPGGAWRELLESDRENLRLICIVSALTLHPTEAAPAEALASEIVPGLNVQVRRASGQKCVRCWHWRDDVGQHPDHPTLCGRCVARIG
jgi:isoleucyl-tRNA synthetase